MGRGNACVFGDYEGLFYVDNDDLDMYRKPINDEEDDYEYRLRRDIEFSELDEWEYDDTSTWLEERDMEINLVYRFTRMFPSFVRCKEHEWITREQRAIMENDLFYVCLEDNQWSVAVELIQKQDPYDRSYEGLQKRHYRRYLDGLRDCLFEQFDEIGTYGGAWTSGKICKTDFQKETEKCSA